MKNILRLTGFSGLLWKEAYFKQCAQEVGWVNVDIISYLDLFYDIDWKFKFIETQKVLCDYDYFWIGGTRGLPFKSSFIYHYIHLLKKKIIDSRVALTLDMSKLSQIVVLNYLSIPIPKSLFFVNTRNLLETKIEIIEERFSYPMVLKDPTLDRGEWVSLVENKLQLRKYLEDAMPWNCVLIQEFIENDWDYRVIATRKGILGVIKRYNKNDFRNNISVWGESQVIENLPEAVENATAQILEKYGLDVAGIDFFIKWNEFYVIEINDLPQYSAFEKATWVSYPVAVLEYIKNL